MRWRGTRGDTTVLAPLLDGGRDPDQHIPAASGLSRTHQSAFVRRGEHLPN
ncbi:hypothetical protein EDC02_5034 [Micromonospora sp. Llam0]|nr:hypothetical protein EDC02_5034 [Micromonospora sp. Llam0]